MRISTVNKEYHYNYPDQREIGIHLDTEDVRFIALITGLSIAYVHKWIRGERKSKSISDVAIEIYHGTIDFRKNLNTAKRKIYEKIRTDALEKMGN